MLRLIVIAGLLCGCGSRTEVSQTFSLTGEGFSGEKFYFGFGEHLSGFMGNEVKYDIRHTNKIFSSQEGGKYQSKTLIDRPVNGSLIKNSWNDYENKINANDMYVQYSSGHGYSQGLAVGVTYDEIMEFALSNPAKEVIIFMMSCYSGNLTDKFLKEKARWQDWSDDNRQLLVFVSSKASQTSSTGPGTDADEAGGPSGSAGSAYGHALWKALIGYADGFVDGIKDGFISLEEIIQFTKWKTESIGGHNPVAIGTYWPQTIMNKVPRQSFRNQYSL